MLAPAGQATARAGQLCWLAALVARRQAPRTSAVVNFRLFVGAAYMRPANLPPHLVSPSPPCRGRACPARNLPPNPFHGLIRRGGIHPSRALPAAANSHGGQRAGRPTTPLKNPCVGQGALTPPPLFPSRTPAVFAYSLQTLPFPHKTGDIFAKPLPRLYRTMVDTRKKRRYNRVVPMRTHPKHYTKNNIGEKGEYFT